MFVYFFCFLEMPSFKMLTLSITNRSKYKELHPSKNDDLLESIGLIRHVVPKDGNSLFRCISQCVFLTQSYHKVVRQHLLQFANFKTDEFNELTHQSVREYERKITNTRLDGEMLDLYIAARYYKIKIFVHTEVNPCMPFIIETQNFIKTLLIYFNLKDNTYDLVFSKESVINMSFCQAIVYEMLYKQVFELTNVDYAVNEMLFNTHISTSYNGATLEKRANCADMKELLDSNITPFPFKVAKALNPTLYRNTEYDIWLNNKREKFYGRWNNWEFKVGSKCLVTIDNHDYYCYIQHIGTKYDPVEVYVKDLAKKVSVGFNQLKLITVEQDMMEMVENPVEVDEASLTVSSTYDDNNRFLTVYEHCNEKCESFIQNSNILVCGPAVHGVSPPVVPGQILSHSCYGQPYQQQPTFSMTPLNSYSSGRMMHPWYVANQPPSFLPNTYFPLLEFPSNLNNKVVQNPNFLPVPTPSWYFTFHQPPNMPYNYVQYTNACQPSLVSEFDVPASEYHQ